MCIRRRRKCTELEQNNTKLRTFPVISNELAMLTVAKKGRGFSLDMPSVSQTKGMSDGA